MGSMTRAWSAGLAGVVVAGAGWVAMPAQAAPDPEMSVAPMPVSAVGLARAGEVAVWGDDSQGQLRVPAELSGVAVKQVAAGDGVVMALTGQGKVVAWGANAARLQRVPAAVSAATVTQIAMSPGDWAGAVTSTGKVHVWGLTAMAGSPAAVPASVTGVKQLALSDQNAAAIRTDGSVVAWGRGNSGVNDVPAGLRATALSGNGSVMYALTTDGTVVGWGSDAPPVSSLPVAVRTPGNVLAVAAGLTGGGSALLADHSLVHWQSTNGQPAYAPANMNGATAASLASGGKQVGIIALDGTLRNGLQGTEAAFPTPAALNGRAVAQFAIGHENGAMVITKVLRDAAPRVVGAVKPGVTVSSVAGTFSGAPSQVRTEWLLDGAVVASTPTLAVTAAMAGKKLSVRSVATKGTSTASSASVPVVVPKVVAPPAVKVASRTTVSKVKVAKKAASVVVTGKVASVKSPTGRAVVTIKKGKKVVVTRGVTVPSSGVVKVTVKKFGKTAIKKTKSKSKTGYRGKYSVSISYQGNTLVKPSSGAKAFTIKR